MPDKKKKNDSLFRCHEVGGRSFLRNAFKSHIVEGLNISLAVTFGYRVSYRYIPFDYGGLPMWSFDVSTVSSFGVSSARVQRSGQTEINTLFG